MRVEKHSGGARPKLVCFLEFSLNLRRQSASCPRGDASVASTMLFDPDTILDEICADRPIAA